MNFVKVNIALLILLSYGRILAQQDFVFSLFGGPSISNHLYYFNDELTRFSGPKNPLPSLTFHLGGEVEYQLKNRFLLRSSLYLERKAASKEKSFIGYHEVGDFIGVALASGYKPIKDKEFRFELGLAIDYLFYRNKFFPYSTRWEYCGMLGIHYDWTNKYGIRIRWIEPLFYLSRNKFVNSDDVVSTKTQSVQFSCIYKLN